MGLIRRVHEVPKLAKENLEESQFQYKAAHDAHFMEKPRSIEVGDFCLREDGVPRRRYIAEVAMPDDGSYEVRQVHTHNFELATATGLVKMSSDCVTKTPFPQDLCDPLPFFNKSRTGNEPTQADDLQEFVVDYIVGHGEGDEAKKIVRIRWHGYEDRANTWEPVGEIPRHFIKRYCSKKKIPLSNVLSEDLLDESFGPNKANRQMLPAHEKKPGVSDGAAPHGRACD